MKCKINFTNIKKFKTEDVRCILVVIYWIDARIGNINLINNFFLTWSILKKNMNDIVYSLSEICNRL